MKKTYKKTAEKLTSEGTELRQPVAELEAPATDYKQAEQALRESEYKYRTIFENVSDVIIRLDKYGKVIDINGRVEECFGYRPEEVIGKNFASIGALRLKDLPEMVKLFGEAIRGERAPSTIELEAKRKDGSTVLLEVNTALVQKDGKAEGAVAIVRDITERKRVEKALREAELRYRIVADFTYDWEFWENPDGTYRYVSPSCERITGYEVDEFISNPDLLLGIMVAEDKEIWLEQRRQMAQKRAVYESQFRIQRKDGEIRWIEHICQPVLDEQGVFLGYRASNRDNTKRKKADQALADEATRRHILIDQSLDGIVVLDENAKVYEANQKFAEMLGYTPEEVRELHTWDWDKNFPPEKLLEMGRNVDEKGLHLETKHHRKDGSVIEVDISINGAVIAGQKLIFCVCRDVTERKRAEETLQTILKTALDGFYLADLEGKILEVNGSYCKMLGYTREELLEMSTQDIEAIESPEETIEHIKNVMAHGSDRFESQHKRKDGKIIDVEVSVNYLDTSQGQLFVFARDITERKKAEQALRDSEEKTRKMFDSVTDGISVVDLNSVITEVNQRTVEMHGLGSKDELIGKNAFDLVAPHDREKIARNMGRAIKERTISGIEYALLKSDGSEFPAELSTSALKDASGKVIGHITIARDITERKRAEEALQAEKNKLQSLIDAMEDQLTIRDKDYNVTYQNEPSKTDFGDCLGEKCYRAFEGRDEVCHGCPVEKAFKDGKSHTSERRVVTLSGKFICLETTASLIRDASGEIVACLEIGRDITERKKAEQALQAEKNKLQSLIDALEDDLSIQDKHYNIIYQNESSRISSGGDRTGEKCYRAYEGKDKIDEDCPVKKAFKDGKSHTSERKWVKPSGEVIFWEATANPVRDAEGNIVSCLEVARNITERKKTEQALKESEEFSTSLLTNSPNPMLVINQDTSVRYVNPALEKLTGFSPQEVIGRKAPYPWWTEETLKKTAKDLGQAMRQGARRLEELFQKKNGELFWVEITSTPVTSDGEFKYYLANWVDITERKQAAEREKEMQQELLLSSRLASIGELAAGVAHQINNPLTGVLGFSQRLLKRSTDQETKQDLERIYTEAERAAKVVQNLLTFARRRQPHKQYSDINEILESALELRDYELRTSNIEVITNLTPELPEIMLDFYHIQEVFLNIILNAEQALTEAHNGGKLTIQTEKRKEYIRTTFTDDGPGIPAERLDNIFDPFYTTKGEKGGTGLGLSVCHGIITEHGGKIYAKSKPGKGTTFFVELPLTPN